MWRANKTSATLQERIFASHVFRSTQVFQYSDIGLTMANPKWSPFRRVHSSKAGRGDGSELLASGKKIPLHSPNRRTGGIFSRSAKKQIIDVSSKKSQALVIVDAASPSRMERSTSTPPRKLRSSKNVAQVQVKANRSSRVSQQDSVSTVPEDATDPSSTPAGSDKLSNGSYSISSNLTVERGEDRDSRSGKISLLANYTPEISHEVVSQAPIDQGNLNTKHQVLHIREDEEEKYVSMPSEVVVGGPKTCPIDELTTHSELTDEHTLGISAPPMLHRNLDQANEILTRVLSEKETKQLIQQACSFERLRNSNQETDRALRRMELANLKKQLEKEKQRIRDQTNGIHQSGKKEITEKDVVSNNEGIELNYMCSRMLLAQTTSTPKRIASLPSKHFDSPTFVDVLALDEHQPSLARTTSAGSTGLENSSRLPNLTKNQTQTGLADTIVEQNLDVRFVTVETIAQRDGVEMEHVDRESCQASSHEPYNFLTHLSGKLQAESQNWFAPQDGSKPAGNNNSHCGSDPDPFSGIEKAKNAALGLALKDAQLDFAKAEETSTMVSKSSGRSSGVLFQGKSFLKMLKKGIDKKKRQKDVETGESTDVDLTVMAKANLSKMAAKRSAAEHSKKTEAHLTSRRNRQSPKKSKRSSSKDRMGGIIKTITRSFSGLSDSKSKEDCADETVDKSNVPRERSLLNSISIVEDTPVPTPSSDDDASSGDGSNDSGSLSEISHEDEDTFYNKEGFPKVEIPKVLSSLAESFSRTVSWTTGFDLPLPSTGEIHQVDSDEASMGGEYDDDLVFNRSFSFESKGSVTSSQHSILSDDMCYIRNRFSCM